MNKIGANVLYDQSLANTHQTFTLNSTSLNGSAIIKPALVYRLNSSTYLNFGGMFIFGEYKYNSNNNYVYTEYTHESGAYYHSLVNGFSTLTSYVYSVFVGITFGIYKGYSEDDRIYTW